MIVTLARAEAKLALRDGRLRTMAVVVALLCVLSVTMGALRHRALERAMLAAQRQTEQQFVEQGAKSPHSAAHYGVYAFRPEPALGFFDRGLDDLVGVAVFLEPHRPRDFEPRAAEEQTALGRFGSWTLAGMLQSLVPLLIVVMAAGSIASERERGTLRLLLAEGVRPWQLACGKALGISCAIACVVLPSLVLATLATTFFEPLQRAEPLRVLLLVLAYSSYFVAFLAVAMAISAWSASGRGAMTAALCFWALTVIAGPRMVTAAVRHVHAVPDALAWRQAGHSWSHDAATWQAEEAKVVERALREHGVQRREQLPFDVSGQVLQNQEDLEAPKFDRQYAQLHDAYRQRDRAIARGGSVAPLLAVQSVSMAAVGTDTEHAIDFWHQAERHRREMVRTLNAAIGRRPAPAEGRGTLGDASDWAEVPSFVYVTPAPGVAAATAREPLLLLIGWVALGLVGCALALRRLEAHA